MSNMILPTHRENPRYKWTEAKLEQLASNTEEIFTLPRQNLFFPARIKSTIQQ